MYLSWHKYKYFPYEKEFAFREIESLLQPKAVHDEGKLVRVDQPKNRSMADRLVYFAASNDLSSPPIPTQQSILEKVNGNGVKRQSTRYSAHGLHEYKGKFNPQAAKAILNMFNAQPGQVALDPFCGSGTTLVECAHLGIRSIGTDINPLAAFLANVKLHSLAVPAKRLIDDADTALQLAKRSNARVVTEGDREEYLRSWFPEQFLDEIERLKSAIESIGGVAAKVLLAVASNLLREYSLQEPKDLRIRRRKSELPKISFFTAFETAVQTYSSRLSASQDALGLIESESRALNVDCRVAHKSSILSPETFDLALTSPPYATALPYIDTQRLSLVWLDLVNPGEIAALETKLVGSRETRGQNKKLLVEAIKSNKEILPDREVEFCRDLQSALAEGDGFRRQMVPSLLYRYFSGMAGAFSAVSRLVKPGAPFGLIVGGNHTVLGGNRFEIDTPGHLANIATYFGWRHVESIPLQTYKRYGLHSNNATNTESLVILQADK